MTTHDQHTAQSDLSDEAQPVTGGAQPVTEHTAPTVHAGPSTAPTESSLPQSESPPVSDQQNQSRPSVVPPDPSSATAVSGTEAPAGPTEESVRETHESSTERTLFVEDELAGLRARWDSVQAGFVDDPKECVEKADGLVSDLVEQLTASFAAARSRLEDAVGSRRGGVHRGSQGRAAALSRVLPAAACGVIQRTAVPQSDSSAKATAVGRSIASIAATALWRRCFTISVSAMRPP